MMMGDLANYVIYEDDVDEENKENEGIDDRNEQPQPTISKHYVHTCKVFTKEFKCSSNLKQHTRIHTGPVF